MLKLMAGECRRALAQGFMLFLKTTVAVAERE